MNNKFTTFILTIILILLVFISIVVGTNIYSELTGETSNDEMYKIGNIVTEEPTTVQDRELEKNNSSISQNIASTSAGSEQVSQENIKNSYENDINKYFYSQLDKNSKIIYDKLFEEKENLKYGDYVIEYKDQFSEVLSTEEGSDELGRDYQTAIEAFINDNPDVFYLDVNKMYLNIETNTRFFRTTYNVYISPVKEGTYLSKDFSSKEEVESAQKQIEKVKNDIINSVQGSDYDKILKIHDYLVDNIDYDSSYEAVGSYNIYGALVGKKCVCEGYAKSLKYLANALGIKCEIMQGTGTASSGQTEAHAWNCIEIDGKWYLIDATWDDPIIVGSGYKINTFKYRYFLKGTNTFDKDHTLSYQFSDNGKVFEYPSIYKNDY